MLLISIPVKCGKFCHDWPNTRLEAEREEGGWAVDIRVEISMSRLVDIFVFLSPRPPHSHPSAPQSSQQHLSGKYQGGRFQHILPLLPTQPQLNLMSYQNLSTNILSLHSKKLCRKDMNSRINMKVSVKCTNFYGFQDRVEQWEALIWFLMWIENPVWCIIIICLVRRWS